MSQKRQSGKYHDSILHDDSDAEAEGDANTQTESVANLDVNQHQTQNQNQNNGQNVRRRRSDRHSNSRRNSVQSNRGEMREDMNPNNNNNNINNNNERLTGNEQGGAGLVGRRRHGQNNRRRHSQYEYDYDDAAKPSPFVRTMGNCSGYCVRLIQIVVILFVMALLVHNTSVTKERVSQMKRLIGIYDQVKRDNIDLGNDNIALRDNLTACLNETIEQKSTIQKLIEFCMSPFSGVDVKLQNQCKRMKHETAAQAQSQKQTQQHTKAQSQAQAEQHTQTQTRTQQQQQQKQQQQHREEQRQSEQVHYEQRYEETHDKTYQVHQHSESHSQSQSQSQSQLRAESYSQGGGDKKPDNFVQGIHPDNPHSPYGVAGNDNYGNNKQDSFEEMMHREYVDDENNRREHEQLEQERADYVHVDDFFDAAAQAAGRG